MCVINELSDTVLEYPEITIPEQGLKIIWLTKSNLIFFLIVNNKTIQPQTRSWVKSYDGLATLNFFVWHAQSILYIYTYFYKHIYLLSFSPFLTI